MMRTVISHKYIHLLLLVEAANAPEIDKACLITADERIFEVGQ